MQLIATSGESALSTTPIDPCYITQHQPTTLPCPPHAQILCASTVAERNINHTTEGNHVMHIRGKAQSLIEKIEQKEL
jgi:hypothetical protein